MLVILYSSVAAHDSVVRTDFSMQLHNLQILGETEHQLRNFYHRCNNLLDRTVDMNEEGKRNQLFYKMRVYPTLKERMIRDYDNKPEHEQTVTLLMNIIRDQVDDMKAMRTYAENYAQRPQAKNTPPQQPNDDGGYALGLKGGGSKG